MEEEDKEYLRKQNVDNYSDAAVNKTIEKDIGKHSTKWARDNLDISAEFIFDDSEEKIEAKNIKKWEIMWKWNQSLQPRHHLLQ